MASTDFFGENNFFGGSGGGVNPNGSPLSRWIRFPIALVTVSSATTMPIGARVVQARLEITTGYTAGTTISLGVTGTVTAFMTTTENTPGLVETYTKLQDTSIGASAAKVLCTIAGAPAVGAGFVLVEYTTPAS